MASPLVRFPRNEDLPRSLTGLHHNVPHRVEPGALFHVRIAVDREKAQNALTSPLLAKAILDSAKLYEAKMRWHITLFLLMPDHLHALLSFGRDGSMSAVIRDWKRFHSRINHVSWQALAQKQDSCFCRVRQLYGGALVCERTGGRAPTLGI